MIEITLPKRDGTSGTEKLLDIHSLVIVGANGAGKSRLGYWMEQQKGRPTHRVSAQRSLVFKDDVAPVPFDAAERKFYTGNSNLRLANGIQIGSRWGDSRKALSHLLNDYDDLLSLLFAYTHRRNREYVDVCRSHKIYAEPAESKLEQLIRIWHSVLPHRELIASDDKVQAKVPGGPTYAALDMSDGERVTFYLIGEALTSPENAIVIVDEPEIHLHRAIQSRLWDEIEGARPDCLFVYITHDLDFAASRTTATKIVVSSYDGKYWKWETLPAATPLPNSLLIQVLGSRRPALFVEGDASSLDVSLLSLVLPEYLIIPRGGCEKVVESTKGLRELPALHHLQPIGLIDRDYRTDEELDALKSHGVFAADVAEIENLLCIDELTGFVAEHLKLNVETTIKSVHDFVLGQLRAELDQQVINRTQREMAYRLAGFGAKAKTKLQLQTMVTSFVASIDVEKLYSDNHTMFTTVINDADFSMAIKLYNRKSLASRISTVFGLKEGQYSELVIRLLKDAGSARILASTRSYLPTFS